MSVRPSATAAITEKKGRLSILRPGNGIGWILSTGATRWDFLTVRSIRRVRPLAERYSGDMTKLACMFLRTSISISRNSTGARRSVISELVTRAAAINDIASIGSSEGW